MKTIFKLSGFFILSLALFSVPAFAGSYDIKEMTPAIQAAIAGRQARFNRLAHHKAGGALGENNRGYVTVRKETGDAQSVAVGENKDRGVIYQAIVSQNHLGASGLDVVETVFAEVQKDRAKPGESVQLPSGQWTRK